jgi:hypothetical protein
MQKKREYERKNAFCPKILPEYKYIAGNCQFITALLSVIAIYRNSRLCGQSKATQKKTNNFVKASLLTKDMSYIPKNTSEKMRKRERMTLACRSSSLFYRLMNSLYIAFIAAT